MKICYITSTIEVPYRQGLGSGGSTHAFEVAKTLAAQGEEVTLLCGRVSASQPVCESLGGITICRLFIWNSKALHRLRNSPWLWRILRIPYYLIRSVRHTLQIVWLARKQRFDLIYERSSNSTLAGTWASLLLGIPLVVELNDRCYPALAIRVARRIVTPDRDMLPRDVRAKAKSLEWGVNTRLFHPSVDGSSVRRHYGLESREVILFVGSGLPWHGLQEIVQAAPLVLRYCREVTFLIAGGGTDLEALRRTVEETSLSNWFRFTGAVEYEKVPGFIAAADIALAPYNSRLAEDNRHRFASPLKVLEYMAAGKAVIVTRVANIRGTVKHGVNGLVIPEDSPDALAEAILRLLRDPTLRNGLGERARKAAAQNFSWDAHCKALRQMFVEARGLTARTTPKRLSKAEV